MDENKEILQPKELTDASLEQTAGGAAQSILYTVVKCRTCGHVVYVDAPAGQWYVGMCPECGELIRENVSLTHIHR